jgi:integrase
MQKKVKTKVPGVRYREHPTRKHGLHPDKYFFIRYRLEGKVKEEGLGWSSEGWTMARAAELLAELKRNARTGEGERTLKEKRAKAEAEKARIEAEQEAAEQAKRLEQETRFGTVFERYCASNRHKKSLTTERIYYDRWIDPIIGGKRLDEITPFDLERIKRKMISAKRSARTLQYIMAIVRQVFNFGVKQGLFSGSSPTKAVSLPRFDNGRMRFLTAEEATALLDELKQRSRQTWAMALIAVCCGLRFSEIAKLRWQNIDTENGTMTIFDTKNGRSRVALMTDQVRDMFSEMPRGKANELIFPDQNGGIMKRVSPAFFRAVEKLGLNTNVEDKRLRVVFHSLRHSFGSWLIEGGADMAVVRDLLGHRDFQMLSRYSHSGENARKAAVRGLEAVLNREMAKVIPMQRAKS